MLGWELGALGKVFRPRLVGEWALYPPPFRVMSEISLGGTDLLVRQGRFAYLTALFIAPAASVAAVLHLYSGASRSFVATMVTLAILFWVPVNPISASSVLAVMREKEEWPARALRLTITWAGVLAAVLIGHAYLAEGLSNLRSIL